MTLPRHSPTVSEAAEYIGVNKFTILRWIDKGRIRTTDQEPFPCRAGWRWRLDPDDVEREMPTNLGSDNGS
jgi:excisionase family DNA binding protein